MTTDKTTDAIADMSNERLAAHRSALATRAAQLAARFSGIAKSDPDRARLVGEEMAMDVELKAVNAELKRRNVATAAHPFGKGQRQVPVYGASATPASDFYGLAPLHVYAGAALAAIIVASDDVVAVAGDNAGERWRS